MVVIVALGSFGGRIMSAQVAKRLPSSLRLRDQIPPNLKGHLDRIDTNNGVFVRPSFRHS